MHVQTGRAQADRLYRARLLMTVSAISAVWAGVPKANACDTCWPLTVSVDRSVCGHDPNPDPDPQKRIPDHKWGAVYKVCTCFFFAGWYVQEFCTMEETNCSPQRTINQNLNAIQLNADGCTADKVLDSEPLSVDCHEYVAQMMLMGPTIDTLIMCFYCNEHHFLWSPEEIQGSNFVSSLKTVFMRDVCQGGDPAPASQECRITY
jgi:hypothetical protein